MFPKRILAVVLCANMIGAIPSWGQDGVSSMSVGAARAGFGRVGSSGEYLMPPADLFRVEEFINYHHHRLPRPSEGQRVRLDIQRMPLDDSGSVVQIGIATPKALDPEVMPPLNIVLVIDRSGSMTGEKIANVKASIRAFIERFRPNDRVTIVGFSDTACVHLDACETTKIDALQHALDAIEAGGSTNLHAGLMMGYEQALKQFDRERTNRVILLTDGVANVGVIDASEIARQSRKCNDRGVSLSTIGLGEDIHHDLLRELADAGRGLIHYVGDAKDIQKTFVSEIDSLLAPAARKVRLKVDFGDVTEPPEIFGYKPKRDGSSYRFKLDDLNHGATQVVIARLPGNRCNTKVVATLEYIDAITWAAVELRQTERGSEELENGVGSIQRNYAIALAASAIRSAAVASNEGRSKQAAKLLRKGIKQAQARIERCEDKDVQRVVEIAENYYAEINRSLERHNP